MALSMIRVFAMALIVACHIAQYYELQIAWILNVGVQVFFIMSGFLFGRLDLPASPMEFYKKRVAKVYIPYLIWLLVVIAIYAAFHLYHFNVKQIVLYLLNLQRFSVPIDGLNHLWFLTVLMFGYLLTPWVIQLLKKYPIICISAFVICGIVEFVFVKKIYGFFAWIALYFAGLFYGTYYSKKTSNIVIAVSAVVLVLLGVRFEPNWLTQTDYQNCSIWLHWVLGLFLFALLYRALPLLIKSNHKYAVVSHLDKISYEVYLTHHPLILGPLSMMLITEYNVLNIMLLLIVVYVVSRVLNSIGSFAKKRII